MSLRDLAQRALDSRRALGEITCTSRPDGPATLEHLGGACIATFGSRKEAQQVHAVLSYSPALADFILRVTAPEMRERIAQVIDRESTMAREVDGRLVAAIMALLTEEPL